MSRTVCLPRRGHAGDDLRQAAAHAAARARAAACPGRGAVPPRHSPPRKGHSPIEALRVAIPDRGGAEGGSITVASPDLASRSRASPGASPTKAPRARGRPRNCRAFSPSFPSGPGLAVLEAWDAQASVPWLVPPHPCRDSGAHGRGDRPPRRPREPCAPRGGALAIGVPAPPLPSAGRPAAKEQAVKSPLTSAPPLPSAGHTRPVRGAPPAPFCGRIRGAGSTSRRDYST